MAPPSPLQREGAGRDSLSVGRSGREAPPASKRCVLPCRTGAGGLTAALLVAGRTLAAPGRSQHLRRDKMAGAPRLGTQSGRRARIGGSPPSTLSTVGIKNNLTLYLGTKGKEKEQQ
ncbi:hypothetical protein NDU88_002655 [Pleurodeles waltl]|uniref:Uncharacterized protein n=1 Tax=Pleurodeles waltl TaxID=8319 RepID=A0AAV7WM36_PLEWA|nr:hypothetical protein NDU88_002655 [Pleurodeles waltl]